MTLVRWDSLGTFEQFYTATDIQHRARRDPRNASNLWSLVERRKLCLLDTSDECINTLPIRTKLTWESRRLDAQIALSLILSESRRISDEPGVTRCGPNCEMNDENTPFRDLP